MSTSKKRRTPPGGGGDSYIRRRFFRFFPWTFSAFLFTVVIVKGIISPVSSPIQLLDYLNDSLSEILLIKMNGIVSLKGLINPPTWTISSMLIVEFILCYCYDRWNNAFKQFIVPLSIIVGLGIWANLTRTNYHIWTGVTSFGTFRAWIMYCAGYYCFLLSKKYRAISLNQRGEIVLTCIECLCYTFSIWVMMNRATRFYLWSVALIMVATIAISISGHSLLNRILNSREWLQRACRFLGELSLSVFLTHWALLTLFQYWFPEPEVRYAYKFHFIFLVLICSLMQWYIVPRCVSFLKKGWAQMKGALINAQ